MNLKLSFVFGIAIGLSGLSQAFAQSAMSEGSSAPTFAVHTTTRSVQAVNYQHRGGSTKIDFSGTRIMPSAAGQATIKSQRGSIAIEAEFGALQKSKAFGTEYLTYVLWAISPEGRGGQSG